MAKAAFIGSFEPPITFRVLGESVIHRLKVYYEYTPNWPYLQWRQRKERTGNYQLDLGLWVLAVPRGDKGRTAPPAKLDSYWAHEAGAIRRSTHYQMLGECQEDCVRAIRG